MKISNIMRISDERGSAAIILCLVFTALLGFTVYVADIGMVYAEKSKLVNAIDSAALAAVLELPENEAKARGIAIEYLEKNNMDPDNAVITIGSDQKSIEIQGIKNVKHFFGPVIKIYSSNVSAAVKAIIGPAKSVKGGIRPFAVEIFDYSYGTPVVLKENAGDGYKGNYGAVALGGRGADVFRNNALYGYSGTISVGDLTDTETGNMAGAANAIKTYINSENSSFDNFPRDSIRLWTLPLVGTLETNGRGQVEVVGFGQFFVEDIVLNSGKMEIVGRFVRYVANAVIDESLNDTGVYGAKLVRQ